MKLNRIAEATATPTKPSAPPKPSPTKPAPRPSTPWNPPKPAELPDPKADSTSTPTKPGAPTKPSPTKPRPKPPSPWNPPKPKELPLPKAKRRQARLAEAYEDEVNPSTQRFWGGLRTSGHTFGKHPLLAMYGEESAKKAFDDTIERLSRAFPQHANRPPRQRLMLIYQEAMNLFMRMGQLESRYRPQLEQIAKELVHETYGIPMEALVASLSIPQMDPQQMTGELEVVEPEAEQPITPRVQEQINKRITMNMLTQGAAVHNMMTMHHLATDKLNALNPQLVQMYQQLSPGMLSMYWLVDFVAMAGMLNLSNAAGQVRVSYDNDSEEVDDLGEQEDNDFDYSSLFDDDQEEEQEPDLGIDDEQYDGPKVIAHAQCFPILLQELVKGTMEILSLHGWSDMDRDTLKQVKKHADVITDEPWLIQVGPHIWRSFLKIVPRNSDLANIVMKLAMKDPKFIHDLLSKTIEEVHFNRDPVEQREAIQDMIDEIEEYTGEDIDDLDEGF